MEHSFGMKCYVSKLSIWTFNKYTYFPATMICKYYERLDFKHFWVTLRFQCIQMQNLYTLILKRETESLVKIAASSELNTHERMWRWKHIHPIIKGLLFCAILYCKRQIILYGLKSLLLYVTFFRYYFLRN